MEYLSATQFCKKNNLDRQIFWDALIKMDYIDKDRKIATKIGEAAGIRIAYNQYCQPWNIYPPQILEDEELMAVYTNLYKEKNKPNIKTSDFINWVNQNPEYLNVEASIAFKKFLSPLNLKQISEVNISNKPNELNPNFFVQNISDKGIIEYPILIFDTETTGLSPEKDDLLQFSAILLYENGYYDTFSTYIRPENKTFWPEAEKVNHISPAMVKYAPTLKNLTSNIEHLFKTANTVVGHNVLFDFKFIAKKFNFDLNTKYIDTLELFRKQYQKSDFNCPNYVENHKLETGVKLFASFDYYSMFKQNAHNSLTDIHGTTLLLKKLLPSGNIPYQEKYLFDDLKNPLLNEDYSECFSDPDGIYL